MPSTVYLVTGGTRSGKSSYAQRLCESLCPNPIYLATSSSSSAWTTDDDTTNAVVDADFCQRIQRHQADRGDHWTTIEETLTPTAHAEQFSGRVVLVDCLTLWLTNYFVQQDVFATMPDGTANAESTDGAAAAAIDRLAQQALEQIKKEFDALVDEPWNVTFVVVTNELGSGTHASTLASRKFVDAHGWFNQHVAHRAQRVVHMICGVPHVIKNNEQEEACDDPRNPLRAPTPEQRDQAKMLDKFLSTRGLAMDANGYFLVKLDRTQGVIKVSFHSCILNDQGECCDFDGNKIPCHGPSVEPLKVWNCRTAKEATTEIFERWPHAKEACTVGHAAYIGREVQKAEDCLYSGRHYQQD